MSWHDMVVDVPEPPSEGKLVETAVVICNRLGIELTPGNIQGIVISIKELLENHYGPRKTS